MLRIIGLLSAILLATPAVADGRGWAVPPRDAYITVSDYVRFHCNLRAAFLTKAEERGVTVQIDADMENWFAEVSADIRKLQNFTVIGEVPDPIVCE